jgi:hypothetical protein
VDLAPQFPTIEHSKFKKICIKVKAGDLPTGHTGQQFEQYFRQAVINHKVEVRVAGKFSTD